MNLLGKLILLAIPLIITMVIDLYCGTTPSKVKSLSESKQDSKESKPLYDVKELKVEKKMIAVKAAPRVVPIIHVRYRMSRLRRYPK